MSDFGFRANPSDNGGGNTQHSGNSPQRDAWNNPIKQDNRGNGGNSNGNGNGGNSDDNSQNDDGINDDVIDKIWDKVEAGGGNNSGNSGGNNGNNGGGSNNPPPKSIEEQQQEYLRSVGLDSFKFNPTDEEKEAIRNGDYSSMYGAMNAQIVQSHVKALSGAKTMIDKAVQDAVKTAKTEAQAAQLGRENIQKLNEALPFTKQKAFAPVAATIMQQFLNRGADTEKAIKGVRVYFDNLAEEVNGMSVNRNRNQNFSSTTPKRNEDQNWVSVLSPSQRG